MLAVQMLCEIAGGHTIWAYFLNVLQTPGLRTVLTA